MKFLVLILLLACGWMAYQLLSRPKKLDNNQSPHPHPEDNSKPKNVEDLEQDPKTGVYKSRDD